MLIYWGANSMATNIFVLNLDSFVLEKMWNADECF